MILFQQDWAREGGTANYDTKNKSFLRSARVLQQMGLQNWAFPLALIQKDLAKYDPRNLSDPSQELRMRIGLECKINPWYFYREVCYVPASGSGTIPFKANRANIAMIWSFYNNIHYIAIQPRQTGKTVTACAIATHVMYIGGTNIEITLYTKDSALVHANVGRIKTMREALPNYLVFKQIKDTDNKEGLSYEVLHNRYRTAIAKDSKHDADNLGRGMTSPFIHIDEPGFCDNIHITLPITLFSTLEAVRNAREAGQPHSNIYTTTAAPIDTERGRYTFDLVNKAMPMSEKIYDLKDKVALQALVRSNSKNDMINGTYSYLMLGRTREWYEDACRTGGATQEVNDRELLNKWSAGTDTSILDYETIKLLNENKREPHYTEIIVEYVVRWYLPESFVRSSAFSAKRYILGMDSSENIGQDFTTLVMIDVSDMSVAAAFRCNESNTIKIGMFIAELLMMYRNVTWIPERNSTGGAIIDVVTMVFQRNHISPFRRIYNEVVQQRDDENMKDINLDDSNMIDTSVKKHLGFRTTGKSRPYLYKNTLKKAAGMNATRIHDSILIGELSTLSTSNGRIDHVEGGHDDMVIAYLLACWLIFFGKNLHLYGIDVRLISMNITSDGKVIDPVHRDRQMLLRSHIKQYQDMIESATSQIVKQNYMQKLMLLQSQVDHSITIEPVGVSKVNQEVSDYGKNLYTPQAFASHLSYRPGASQNVQNLSRLV